jgi:hypothetical protein
MAHLLAPPSSMHEYPPGAHAQARHLLPEHTQQDMLAPL